MAARCPPHDCPCCGDMLIHQFNRGHHESSSALGQYVHNHPDKQFYWMDVDGLVYKSSDKRLRFIEHKPIGGDLSKGQTRVLPLLARAVAALVRDGHINHGSVVVLTGNPPFDTRSSGTLYLPDGGTRHCDLCHDQVDQLITGRAVTFPKQEAA